MADLKTLDFRGVDCPEPLIRVIREITTSNVKTLIVFTDIEECVRLISEAVLGFNLGDIKVNNKGKYYELKIVKNI